MHTVLLISWIIDAHSVAGIMDHLCIVLLISCIIDAHSVADIMDH